jgi:cytidylate kinase
MVAAFGGAATPVGPVLMPAELPDTPERFRDATKAALEEVAAVTGAVILGRAGMAVLGGRSDVLCVRLDGPVEARIAQVVALGVDEATARQGQREVDRARDAYARVFFDVRQDDPRLYHVILDSTVLSVEACVDIVVRAAHDRLGSVPS